MTAREMFEELGWEQDKNNCNIIEYCKGFRSIVFLKYNKEVIPSCHLTMDLLKSVNKQCKELGWLDVD